MDLNYKEDGRAVDVPVAILKSTEKIVMLQMDSKIDVEKFEKVMDLAIDGAREIGDVMKEYILKRTKKLLG